MLRKLFTYCLLLFLIPVTMRAQDVATITVDGAINPVSADFIHNSIERAAAAKATCLVIQLNTPGGLLKSTRSIVSDIFKSPVPIVVYVAPGGAHAGSAGVFVTLAAHVAVMAPGTNIGAAHPVVINGQMDSTMNSKATNDAAAFIRTIAEKRNRNKAWAERAVRTSDAFTETEALQDSAIDFVANNMGDLLKKLEGKTVTTWNGSRTIRTATASVTTYEMSFSEKLLDMISDPNVAYILLMLGMIGLFFELSNPGVILPGVVGGISIILAFYAMNSLPVNYAGLALIIFAIILFILEIKVVSHGLLSIGGVISLLIGSLMLIKSTPTFEVARISLVLIIATTIITSLFFIFIVGLGLKAQARPVSTGVNAMIGKRGVALETLSPEGSVRVVGEIWKAVALSGDIAEAAPIVVREIKNFVLYVDQVETS